MNMSFGLSLTAPQTSGDPASLPETPPAQRSDSKVEETSKAEENADSGLDTNARENNAPPSAIQIRISEMLEQQAELTDPD